ncbi:MAG: transglutaminase [bacterium]|nr:transglutaminase [bacterium]
MYEKYLEKSKYVDYDNESVYKLALDLKNKSSDKIDLIKNTYHYVRDNIKHSWDAQDRRVSISASDCLNKGVGICWAKANLLAALLRANNIPSGFSYQRLTLGDTIDSGYCIHALNTVYISELDKWIRLDARGNKIGVNAEFSLDEDILAFKIKNKGEIDYHDNHSYPDKRLMKVLEESNDALDMYLHHLPDKLSYDEE